MRRLALLMMFSITAAFVHGATLNDADIAQLRSAPDVQEQLKRIERSVNNRETNALVTLAARVRDDGALVAASRELLLATTASALATLPATSASMQMLQSLTTYPTQTWLDHEHAGTATRIPAFDVQAAARFALDQHAIALAAAKLSTHLSDRSTTPQWSAGQAANGAVASRAAQSMNADRLSETLPELLATLPSAPELAGAAIHAAVTLGDPVPLLAVLAHGSNRDALNALRASDQLGDTALTLSVIDAAIKRPDTASAALGALADHVRRFPAHTPRLLAWFDRADTALAAAYAVAKLDRPDIAANLGARLLTVTDRQQATALALALTLMRNDTAKAQLQAYLIADEGLPALKRKLRTARQGVAQ